MVWQYAKKGLKKGYKRGLRWKNASKRKRSHGVWTRGRECGISQGLRSLFATIPPLRGSFLLCYNLHHVPAAPPHGANHDGAPAGLAGRARPATSIVMGMGIGDSCCASGKPMSVSPWKKLTPNESKI